MKTVTLMCGPCGIAHETSKNAMEAIEVSDLIFTWNGINRGQPVKLVRNVYQRLDGSAYGGIYYEPPGHLIAKRDMVGTFTAKTPLGVLVYFNNGVNSILGLVLDEFAIEKYTGK